MFLTLALIVLVITLACTGLGIFLANVYPKLLFPETRAQEYCDVLNRTCDNKLNDTERAEFAAVKATAQLRTIHKHTDVVIVFDPKLSFWHGRFRVGDRIELEELEERKY